MSGTLTPLRLESPVPNSTTVDGAVGGALGDAQAHLAVVEQQAVADLKRLQDFRVRQLDAVVVAGRRVGVQHERLPRRQA